MRFAAVALCAMPDVAAARRCFAVAGLQSAATLATLAATLELPLLGTCLAADLCDAWPAA